MLLVAEEEERGDLEDDNEENVAARRSPVVEIPISGPGVRSDFMVVCI